MNILELLDGVIRKPAAALNQIAQEKPIGWALIIYGAVTLLSVISTDRTVLEQIPNLPQINAISSIIFSLVGLFVMTGYLHLLSRIFKGSGGYWGLFSTLGFAQFPGVLAPIAAVIRNTGGAVGSVLGGLISLISGIWVLVLYVIALRESRSLTTGTSILTYLIGVLIIALPLIAVMVYLIGKLGLF